MVSTGVLEEMSDLRDDVLEKAYELEYIPTDNEGILKIEQIGDEIIALVREHYKDAVKELLERNPNGLVNYGISICLKALEKQE